MARRGSAEAVPLPDVATTAGIRVIIVKVPVLRITRNVSPDVIHGPIVADDMFLVVALSGWLAGRIVFWIF